MGIGVLDMQNPDHRVLHAKIEHTVQYGNIVNLYSYQTGQCSFTGDAINLSFPCGYRNMVFVEKVQQEWTIRGWKDRSTVIGYFISSQILDQIRNVLDWEGEIVIISPLFLLQSDIKAWTHIFDFLPSIRALANRRVNIVDALDWKRQILILLTSDWRRDDAKVNVDIYHRVSELVYQIFAPYPEKVSSVYVTVSSIKDKYGDSDLYALFVYTDNDSLIREYSGFIRRWSGIFEEVDKCIEVFPITDDFNTVMKNFTLYFKQLYNSPHVTLSDSRGTFPRFSIFSSLGLRSWSENSERYSLSYED